MDQITLKKVLLRKRGRDAEDRWERKDCPGLHHRDNRFGTSYPKEEGEMSWTKNISAVAMLLLAALPVFFMLMVPGETFGETIPLPVGQESFTYSAAADPVESADPLQAKPIGIGTAATGGNSVSMQIHIQQFSAPVDIYVACVLPVDPAQIRILQPDLSFKSFAADEIVQALSSGSLPDGAGPWKSNITGPVEEALFGDIPVSSLPQGEYVLYLLTTPHGSLNDYYLWSTSVNTFYSLSGDESPFGFDAAAVAKQGYDNNGYGDASNIGVKWARDGIYAYWFLVQPNLASQTYDFTQYDQQWSRVPAGINILANIAPQGPIDEGRCLAGTYFPVDEQKYVAFVKAVVQRYSGASYATAGLAAPIKYWQVGNEPNSVKSRFADLQRITYTAIKEVCPDCTVLIGGVPGMPPAANYLSIFDLQYKPILDALNGHYVDVMDFHWYGNAIGDYRGAKDAYDHIRSVLIADGFPAMPFWITEMGSYSGDPLLSRVSPIDYALQTEQQQALDYFKRFVYPLSFGVRKVFPAFGLMEGFKHDNGYFDYTGLIYDGVGVGDLGLGLKKLGYYTYKKMTEILEGSDWNSIQTIQQSGNVSIFKFTKNNTPVYVAWWDYFDEPSFVPGNTKTISISGVHGNSARVTEVVPNYSAGKDVTDYATAFSAQTVSASNGTVTLTLNKNPVFVEGLIWNSSAPLVSLAATPANPSVIAENTQQFTATGTYSDNSAKDLTSSVTWISSNPEVAAINNAGLASSASAGTTTITAIFGSVSGSTMLTVTSAGSTSVAVSSRTFTSLNPTSGNTWWAKAFYPSDASAAHPYPAIISVPGGTAAGSASESIPDPLKNPTAQAGKGFVVVIFDADGRGNTRGTEDMNGFLHQDGLKALIEKAATLDVVDAAKIGMVAYSYGITMGSGVLARYPLLPIKFLVDGEGPADRADTFNCVVSDPRPMCSDELFWREREAVNFMKLVAVPYLRIQNKTDHAGLAPSHCIPMINNATGTAYGGSGVSRWTRVNLATQNQPNKIYSDALTPVYNPNETPISETDLWIELFARGL